MIDLPGCRTEEDESQAGDENKEDLRWRTVRHHQPGGRQGLLRTVLQGKKMKYFSPLVLNRLSSG